MGLWLERVAGEGLKEKERWQLDFKCGSIDF